MGSESSQIVLRLDNDWRLVAGVEGAIADVAERVGLDARAQADFVAAVEAVCRSVLDLPDKNALLDLIITGLADRIEVTLPCAGQFGKWPGGLVPLGFGSAVDRVEYVRGAARITLIKYVRVPHP